MKIIEKTVTPHSTRMIVGLGGSFGVDIQMSGGSTQRERKIRRVLLMAFARSLKRIAPALEIDCIWPTDEHYKVWMLNARKELDPENGHSVRTSAERDGLLLRIQREKAGLKQAELSRLTGIARSHISELERGRHRMSTSTRLKLWSALAEKEKVSPSEPNPA